MNPLAFAPIVAEALTEVITANEIASNTWTETPLAYGSVGAVEDMLEVYVGRTVAALKAGAEAARAQAAEAARKAGRRRRRGQKERS